MRVLIGGASGMVGKALASYLVDQECPVVKLVRQPVKDELTEIFWDIDQKKLDEKKLEGFDAVVHLGGANIANKAWTRKYKKLIMDSRVKSTELLVDRLSKLKKKPKVLIVASGLNIYGQTLKDAEPFSEFSAEKGTDFLADVVKEWEKAAKKATDAGIRVCFMRFGAVIGPGGGLLKTVLPIFRWAAGGKMGNGKQKLSWVGLEDAVAAIHHCIKDDTFNGPVNVCTENPVSNKEFTKAMAKAVGMPAFFPVPTFAVRTLFGEMGEILMLSSIAAAPEKLLKSGFEFSQPTMRECLNYQLKVDIEDPNASDTKE